MKILVIRNYPNTMDVDRQNYNIQELGLARALVKKGHTCDLVFWTSGDDIVKRVDCEGGCVNVYYFKSLNILKNGVFPKRLDELAAKYDIVQISEYNQYQSWKYSKKFADRMVLLHGPYYSPFNKRYNLMCFLCDILMLPRYRRLGTHFMVKSALAEDFLLKRGIGRENISKVYVGIDTAALGYKADDAPEFVTSVEAESAPLLLYIGRIQKRRRSIFLLDVLKAVLEKQPDAKLVLVGDGAGSYFDKFCARMRELGLEEHIIWQKKLEQKYVSRLYKKADVFLMTTEFDIFGMVLLEAMYFKTAVITSPCGGAHTLVRNGENGVVIEGFDSDEWAKAALNLLGDEAARSALGEAASRTVTEGFTWDSICENYLRAYRARLGETTDD